MKRISLLLVLVSYTLAATLPLLATIRDFTPQTSADFEYNPIIGFVPGLVLNTLDGDGKPVRSSLPNPATNDLHKWYRATLGVNIEIPITITLDDTASPGLFTYSNSNFFPIDNLGFGNYLSTGHNFHFTTEIITTFTHDVAGNHVFTFTGDDDVFVFIDNRLAIDLGGVHAALSATVHLNTFPGLVDGNTYNLHVFHAERHTFASNFMMQTTLPLQCHGQQPPQQVDVDLCGVSYQSNCAQNPNCITKNEPTFASLPPGDVHTPFLQFNAIVFGDCALQTGDTEGRLGCGGKFSSNGGYSIGHGVITTGANKILDPSTFSFIVGGNLDWRGSGSVEPLGPNFTPGYPNPSQRETTAVGGIVFHVPVGVTTTHVSGPGLQSDFSYGKAYYLQVQSDLNNMVPNAVASQGGSMDCHVVCNSPFDVSYVIQLDSSLINAITSYTFTNCNPNAQYIFNVGGTGSVNFNGDNIHLPGENIPIVKVVWNILGSGRTINVNTEVFGHILACNHHVQQTGGLIVGRLICDSYGSRGASQINQPVCPTPPPPSCGVNPPPVPVCPYFENELTCNLDLSLGNMIASFKDFDVISFGEFNADTGDIQGRLIVGGNLHLGFGFSIGDQIDTTPSGHDNFVNYAAVVGGSAFWGSGALYPDLPPAPPQGAQEGIYVGTTFTAPPYLLARRTPLFHLTHLGTDLANALFCYGHIQSFLASQTVNVAYNVQYLGLHITCFNPTASRYVLKIDGSVISSITWYTTTNCNFGAEWVINIQGAGPVTFNGASFPAIGGGVTYNILGGNRMINVNTEVNGNILAPFNILNQHGGVIIGKVVVGSVRFALQINRPNCPHNIIPCHIPIVIPEPCQEGQPNLPCSPGHDNVRPGDRCDIDGDTYHVLSVYPDHLTLDGNCKQSYDAGTVAMITIDNPLELRGGPMPALADVAGGDVVSSVKIVAPVAVLIAAAILLLF